MWIIKQLFLQIDFAQQNIRTVSMDDVKDKVKAVYDEVTEEGDEIEPLPADAVSFILMVVDQLL